MDEVTIFGLNYFKTYYPERLEERFKGIDLNGEAPEIIMEMTRNLASVKIMTVSIIYLSKKFVMETRTLLLILLGRY